MATIRGLPGDLAPRLVLRGTTGHVPRKCSKLKVFKGTVYFHIGVAAATEDTDTELPTGYSVGPSNPKAWPFLTVFDDPKVYAMRELQALCEAQFMHLTGGYVFRWEGPPGKSEADKLEQEAL
eukprot:jgi/Tetstr1/433581/TSEL_022848.t1